MIDVKELNTFLNDIDNAPLKEEEKHKLRTLWKDSPLLDKALTKFKTHLTNKMLTEDLSPEFVRWAIFMIAYFRWMTK